MRSELAGLLSSELGQNLKIILVNSFKISNLFNYKDKLPKAVQTSLIYKFSCSQCESTYVGSTIRTLQSRVREHAGRSYRTNQPLTNPPQSAVRDHSDRCGPDVDIDSFSILKKHSNPIELRILESLFIYIMKPPLNNTTSAFPLKMFP